MVKVQVHIEGTISEVREQLHSALKELGAEQNRGQLVRVQSTYQGSQAILD